jgi:uncharacterized repeat protein (TIGR01451 family)
MLSIPGHEYSFTQEVGKPKLPVIQVMLAIPDNVDINLSSLSTYNLQLTTYNLYPVPKQVIKTTPDGYSYIAEEFCEDIIWRNDYGKLANIDLDGNIEIITIKEDTITAWQHDGTLKVNLFTRPGDSIISPMVIADIDLDGDIEIICGGKEPEYGSIWGKVYIWDYEGKCQKGALEWPMVNHDARRTNCYNTDVTKPAQIINLEAKNPTPYSMDLTWTATGDDYNLGTAAAYYIRYATFTITPQNWHLVNKATCTITPKLAGSQESFTVTGLDPNTTYYFCIRARDDECNTSLLSNNATVTTLGTGDPCITLEKTVDKRYILPNQTITYTITYKNTGSVTATDVNIIEVLPENVKLSIVHSLWTIDYRPSTKKSTVHSQILV